MRIPKPPRKCDTEVCNGVARAKGLCFNCAHKKRKREQEENPQPSVLVLTEENLDA